jgi:DNA-binding MarR family transcriptional regulator
VTRRPSARSSPGDGAHALKLLRALVNDLGRSTRSIEKRTGLTNAQLHVLRMLDSAVRDGRSPSIGDIARQTFTRPSTASAVVSRLIEGGLVRRERDRSDRRRMVVSLTARGRSRLARAPVATAERVLDVFGDLAPREMLTVRQGLAILVRALGVDASSPGWMFEAGDDRGAPRARAR